MSVYAITPIDVQTPFGTMATSEHYQARADSERLMIILPGRGYSHDHPVLFHLRYMALENGFDALAVNYGLPPSASPEHFSHLPAVVRQSTAQGLHERCRQVCIMGKSLGTPLAVDLAAGLKVDKIALILLTPISTAFQHEAAGHFPALALIGTDDPYYTPEVVAQTPPNIEWRVYNALNHSLMVEDNWRVSVQTLAEIVENCESFLRDQFS